MLVSFTGELLQFQRQQHEVVGQQLYIHLDYDSRRRPPPPGDIPRIVPDRENHPGGNLRGVY